MAVLLAVAAIGAGCASTQVVRRPASPEAVAAINDASGGDGPLDIEYRPDARSVDPLPSQARSLDSAGATKMNFNEGGFFDRDTRMVMGGIALGAIGAALGAVVGLASGEQTVFLFEDPPVRD